MALVNEHFLKLPGSYLFSDIAKKVNTFRITHPKQEVIRLGIGDVTRPLPPVCIEAMHKAVEEMADARTFRGYGPEQGYDFLIEAILKHDYLPRGIHFGPTEIFVNDGAKSDTGNIGDILRHDNSVGVTDPIYPVYIDSNVMCGRAGVLEEETGIKIEYWDERLSTVAAERTLIQGNVRRENRKGVIDMVAAVIILQGYLDSKRIF